MALKYLDFDCSIEPDGSACFDALAAVAPAHLASLHAEVAEVLCWADHHFADQRGAIDDGGEWDFDLASHQEWTADDGLDFDLASKSFRRTPGAQGLVRHVLSLSITGRAAFAEAFRAAFVVDD